MDTLSKANLAGCPRGTPYWFGWGITSARREKKGWSQERLADEAGVHRTYIGGVERAEYNVTILTLRKITKALGIPLGAAIQGI